MLEWAGINDYCFVAYFNVWKKKIKKNTPSTSNKSMIETKNCIE